MRLFSFPSVALVLVASSCWGGDQAVRSEKCANVENTPQLIATEESEHAGVLVEYDEVRHSDLGKVMRQYWHARLSRNTTALKEILPAVSPVELKRFIEYEATLWRTDNILEQETMAVDFRATNGVPRAIVFSKVLLRKPSGVCRADVVAIEVVFSSGWHLDVSMDDSHFQPLRN